jgi:hypothetical protein
MYTIEFINYKRKFKEVWGFPFSFSHLRWLCILLRAIHQKGKELYHRHILNDIYYNYITQIMIHMETLLYS